MATVENPVALITGAGGGIGRATAQRFAAAGWQVILAGRNRSSLEETAEEASGALVVPTDVEDPISISRLFAQIEGGPGRLDLLFNNAGSNTPTQPIEEVPAEALAAVIASNLTGALLCAREAFALMKRQRPRGGRIINNGSVAATAPRPNSAAYTAAKHGITGLTKSLILDGRDCGIDVCQIDIGNAATPRTEKMSGGVPQADGRVAVEPRLELDLVVAEVLRLAALPPGMTIPFLTIMPSKMPLYGRG